MPVWPASVGRAIAQQRHFLSKKCGVDRNEEMLEKQWLNNVAQRKSSCHQIAVASKQGAFAQQWLCDASCSCAVNDPGL